MQYSKLRVYKSPRPLIEQRIDEPSSNAYSVLPVLSQVGAITREKPLLATTQRSLRPVVVTGPPGTGLTALAMALSMLGYTCINDLDTAPGDDLETLRSGRGRPRFNAFVNIGSIDAKTIEAIAAGNRRALFITTGPDAAIASILRLRTLRLLPDAIDKWATLTDFLGLEYPPFPFPTDVDIDQRMVVASENGPINHAVSALKSDRSPWIIRGPKEWDGFDIDSPGPSFEPTATWNQKELLSEAGWCIRDDTFPSNLALFSRPNLGMSKGKPITLSLRREASSVRDFTSGAIANRTTYLYGSFAAELRPSRVSGTITGLFLHRNGPRQEIDIEFLGKDTTKMLVNVYYNPGPQGTKLEYGYRGTPTEIDLGFDAALSPHRYEIVWAPNFIEWKVDGRPVYRRNVWAPTPIPDRALEFNINLWTSRSVELAGQLDESELPASTEIYSIDISSVHPTEVAKS